MNVRACIAWCSGLAAVVAAPLAYAHHAIVAKFDDTKTREVRGIVTNVDWRNPHVHVFVNTTKDDGTVENWAVELESTVLLLRSGWAHDTLKPGDSVRVSGPVARDGSRQIWGTRIALADGRQVYNVKDTTPIVSRAQQKPVPRGADGKPMLGVADASGGYWAYPTSTVLQQSGANVRMDKDGVLARLSDAPRVAPFQPWALGLYEHRQQRHLADDPGFSRCHASGAARQFQTPYGVDFVHMPDLKRMYILDVGGPHTFRIIYMDGRAHPANFEPTNYGHSVGRWERDTLIVDTVGYSENFWIDRTGLPHTEKLHTIERFTRTDFNTIKYEITVDDPAVYAKPWSGGFDLRWSTNIELFEYICQDNNTAPDLMMKDGEPLRLNNLIVP